MSVRNAATLLDIPHDIIKPALEHDIQQKFIVRVKEKIYPIELHTYSSTITRICDDFTDELDGGFVTGTESLKCWHPYRLQKTKKP